MRGCWRATFFGSDWLSTSDGTFNRYLDVAKHTRSDVMIEICLP